jgi:hypothetical protein
MISFAASPTTFVCKNDNAKARADFENAIKLDGKFAQAYSSLGWSYWNGVWNQWTDNPQNDSERSAQLAKRH